eukprot:6320756-Lingulodinium_polyedra.AAC.1
MVRSNASSSQAAPKQRASSTNAQAAPTAARKQHLNISTKPAREQCSSSTRAAPNQHPSSTQ